MGCSSAVHWNGHPAAKSFPRISRLFRTFEDGVAWYSPFRSAAVWTNRFGMPLWRAGFSPTSILFSEQCCRFVRAVYARMTATKTYTAQYHYILMTGRQTFFTGRHKCRPFTMLKNTLPDWPLLFKVHEIWSIDSAGKSLKLLPPDARF